MFHVFLTVGLRLGGVVLGSGVSCVVMVSFSTSSLLGSF